MRKLLSWCLAVVVMTGMAAPMTQIRAANLTAPADAFKAIVKIRTFTTDGSYDLSEVSNGSGILIGSGGLVLTNNHVVEVKDAFDNTERETGYAVCLPANTTEEPACDYSATVVARNPDLDVALLQISAIPELSVRTDFPVLALASADTSATGDAVTAIGYPGIGDDAVTTSQGIISGKLEKYGKSWIKTDAVTSFGSSGGAAINASGQVIGITSDVYSDLAGTVGYIINIASLNSWIAANMSSQPVAAKLNPRVAAFLKKERTADQAPLFQNSGPFAFSFYKPQGWQAMYHGENQVSVTDPADEDGGYATFTVEKFPYRTDARDIIPYLKNRAFASLKISFFNIKEDKNVTIAGIAAKKVTIDSGTSVDRYYIVPYANGLVIMNYDYGLDDKDKAAVDTMILKMILPKNQPAVKEVKTYSQNTPRFSLSVGGDWAILLNNDKSKPITVMNKKYRDLGFQVLVEKTDEETRKLNNDGLAKWFKDLFVKVNKMSGTLDLSMETSGVNAHAKLNKNITDAVKLDITTKATSEKKILAYDTMYAKKIGSDYIVTIDAAAINPDKKTWALYQKEITAVLQNMTLAAPAPAAAPKKDTDKDGLNDDDEKKYKTNPNKKDTDGDGYSDWEEISKGYNPLGPGKMRK